MTWSGRLLRCWCLPAAAGLLYVLAGVWTISANGSTNDEFAAHITGGYLYWATGTFAGGVNNPPLGQLWVALPLWLSGLPLEPFSDAGPILPRLANLLLSVGLLGWIYVYSRRELGPTAALTALAVTAFCPEFLAHSTLATLELPTTLAIWGAVVSFQLFMLRPGCSRLFVLVFWVAAALLVKVTGLLLLPIFLGLLSVQFVTRQGRRYGRRLFRATRRYSLKWCFGLLFALFTLWLLVAGAYRFSGVGEPKSVPSLFALLAWLLPTGYVEATLGKLAYAGSGNVTYLLGKYSSSGWWWYYPVALVLKTPFPLLVLWAVALVWNLRLWTPRSLWRVTTPLLFLALALIGNRAQIGVRHLLPIVPFLAVCVGALLHSSSAFLRRSAGVLAAAAVVAGIISLPYPLSAESWILGGKGYRNLADANYDWGQANASIRQLLARDPGLLRPAAYTPASGRFVIRVNELNGFVLTDRDQFHWLRQFEPSDRLAGAGLLYDISEAQLEGRYSLPEIRGLTAMESGMYWGARGEWEKAEPHFEAALNSHTPTAKVFYYRGLLLEMQGALSKAYRDFRKAALLEPGVVDYVNASRRLELLVLADKSEHRNRAQAALQRANALLLTGNFRDAAEHVQQARKAGAPAAPADQIAYQAATLSGNWSEALQIYSRSPEVDNAGQALPGDLINRWVAGTADQEDLQRLTQWSYLQQAWGLAATFLLKQVASDPSNSSAAAYIGQIVVIYKDWSVPLIEEDRIQLEKLAIQP